MIIPSEFTVVCHRLESELQKAGLVFGDAQFDESEQALRIVVEDGQRQLSRSAQTDSGDGPTIDARVLWDLLRELSRLGMNPAIQMRHRRQRPDQTHETRGASA
jgi:hypothetical protein